MITMSVKNKKLLSAEELLEKSDALEEAIDIFLIDNVLDNCLYQRFEKEYLERLDAHVREQYPEIAKLAEAGCDDGKMRGIYRENERTWESEPEEIKRLRFDKVGILYRLAKRDKPSMELERYIAELCE